MVNNSPTGKNDNSEDKKRITKNAMSEVILWTLQELKDLEERLAPLGIFQLKENVITNQKLALLPLLQMESVEVQQAAFTFLVPQEALAFLIQQKQETIMSKQENFMSKTEYISLSETELTNNLVWTLRKLQILQDRLEEIGIFNMINSNWLLDFETAMLELLQKPPEELQEELRLIREQNAKISRETAENNRKHDRGGNPSELS